MRERAQYAWSEASRPLVGQHGWWPATRAFVTLVAAFTLPTVAYDSFRRWYHVAFGARQTARTFYRQMRPLATTKTEMAGLVILKFRILLWGLLGRSSPGKEYVVQLYGSRHVISPITNELHTVRELYGNLQYDRVERFVPQPGWVVFDVGANVGAYAVLQARRGATVYAFEPNPDCRRRFARAIALNGLGDRVSVFPWALGSARGTGRMRVPGDGRLTTMGTVEVAPSHPHARSGIAIVTLDEIVTASSVARVDLLKIDVEGAEGEVLRGAQSALQITDRIVVECHSVSAGREVSALLAEVGFAVILRVPVVPDDHVYIYYAEKHGLAVHEPSHRSQTP